MTPSPLIAMALDTLMRINRDESVQIGKKPCFFFAGIAVIDIAAEIFFGKQVPLIRTINLLPHTKKTVKITLPEVKNFGCALGEEF